MANLRTLESQRHKLLEEIAALPPMRKGSVATLNPTGATRDGSGAKRGTYWRYTYKDKNQKTRGCHIAARKLAQAYQAQIAAFRRFQGLSEELLEVSQIMADLAVGKKGAWSKSAR